jgi:hypothetical protein
MRIASAIALVLVTALAHAAKLPPPMRLNLIQASCAVLPPALPGPCSAMFRFANGTVTMKALRQPQPTCPKTGKPTEAPGGTITMTGVTKSGAPFSGSLDAQVSFKTTFGDDPNGNCELRNVVVPNLPSLLGTVACKNGKCKGTVYPIQCLPSQCADTPISSEFGSVAAVGQTFGPVLVFDDAGRPLATPGTALAPSEEP